MESTLTSTGYEAGLDDYVKQERAAVDLINSVGSLMYDKGVELVLFRNHLVNVTISEVINLITYANEVVNKPIDLYESAKIAKAMLDLDLAPSKIDIGKLTFEYNEEKSNGTSISDFLNGKLGNFIGQDKHQFDPKDVILYGFGRIGRLVVRELITQAGKGQQLRLKAIVLRKVNTDDLVKRAALLSNDSVHGAFKGSVSVDKENLTLVVNGQRIQFIQAANPDEIDYTQYGIDNALLIDSTGVFNNKEALGRHLESKGVAKVLLTAPGSGIPNIVYGINQGEFDIENHY